MDKTKAGLVIGGLIVAAVAGVAISQAVHAAPSQYCCPYGDNLCFTTLDELNGHIRTAHPGQRILISITWH